VSRKKHVLRQVLRWNCRTFQGGTISWVVLPVQDKTVLVIDDQVGIRTLISEVIHHLGYQVETAVSGADALSRLKSDTPDLVLLDMNMPGLSGLETLRALREMCPKLPVLMITADERDISLRQAEHLCVAGWVSKPFELQEFCQKVQAALEPES
jgi:CheY-like chemotaxis protein